VSDRIIAVYVSKDPKLLYTCQHLGEFGWACGLCGQPTLGHLPKDGDKCDCGAVVNGVRRGAIRYSRYAHSWRDV